MNFIEKHSKLLAFALCCCASVPVLSTVKAAEESPGWHNDGQEYYYVDENHEKATGLVEIDDDTYYFAGNGYMQTGWQNVSNDIYYFDTDGTAVTGQTSISGELYNFQQTGSLVQGWNDDSYFNERGFLETNAWVQDNGSTYRVDENGNKITNATAEIDGSAYHFNEDGTVAVGLFSIDDKEYVADASGAIQTDTFVDNGQEVRYATEDGSLYNEPELELDGITYLFNEQGVLVDESELYQEPVEEVPVESFEQPAPAVDGLMPEENAADPAYIDPGTVDPETVDPGYADPGYVDPGYTEPENSDPGFVPEADLTDPALIDPGYEEPVVEQPVYDQPAIEQPVVEEPVYESPVVEQPDASQWEATTPETVVEEQPAFEQWEVYEPATTVDTALPQAQPVQSPAASSSGDTASTILSAAMSQLGVNQDCTSLVSNALSAAGIDFHGWPEDYASLGTYTDNPVPGDIIIYSGHVAVYAGDGQAIHGGWNGYTTTEASVNCSQALIGYIHV